MRYLFLFFLITIPIAAKASISDDLPSVIQDAINDAYETENQYVIESVTKYSKQKYPLHSKIIDSFFASLKEDQDIKKLVSSKRKFSGNIDLGINFARGNSKKEDINLSSSLNYEEDNWSNTIKMLVRSSKENDIRTNEEYIVSNQSKYKINLKNYSFLELEHVNDEFSGFKYRNSQLIGYGRKFYNDSKFTLAPGKAF